jgi:hypothetical protein
MSGRNKEAIAAKADDVLKRAIEANGGSVRTDGNGGSAVTTPSGAHLVVTSRIVEDSPARRKARERILRRYRPRGR